mmetsp:Transcript_23251/g.58800  ORF Transcript_23251/g.58800 Transcript_23251/m.58800 type:complete len:279 (+) Transcript_23251:749-1585(+)
MRPHAHIFFVLNIWPLAAHIAPHLLVLVPPAAPARQLFERALLELLLQVFYQFFLARLRPQSVHHVDVAEVPDVIRCLRPTALGVILDLLFPVVALVKKVVQPAVEAAGENLNFDQVAGVLGLETLLLLVLRKGGAAAASAKHRIHASENDGSDLSRSNFRHKEPRIRDDAVRFDPDTVWYVSALVVSSPHVDYYYLRILCLQQPLQLRWLHGFDERNFLVRHLIHLSGVWRCGVVLAISFGRQGHHFWGRWHGRRLQNRDVQLVFRRRYYRPVRHKL